MIIVSVQRHDVVSIDYINMNEGVTIDSEKRIVEGVRGVPIKVKQLDTGAISMDYYHEEYGHETVMIVSA